MPTDGVKGSGAGKWSFDKGPSVKWAKVNDKNRAAAMRYPEYVNYNESGKGLIVGDGSNPSCMKLTFTAKKGTFKGTFKVYALEGTGTKTKLKKYTMKVNSVVVDGVGYGTATCKKPAVTWDVRVV